MKAMKECSAVFEGGGVKGIGHAGAALALEQAGYVFRSVAGSSAGAICASLLAAGYTGAELENILKTLNFKKFKQSRFGAIGNIFSTIFAFGAHKTRYFENWIYDLLSKKGVVTFGDLPAGKLKITASDVTAQRLLVLPDDLTKFGISPGTFPVALAVTMSMSIPLFFRPQKLKATTGATHYIVDGGLLSNYPIWILDKGTGAPPVPVFGLRFADDGGHEKAGGGRVGFLEYTKDIVNTALEAHDTGYIYNVAGDSARTITIPVTVNINGKKKKISATDFDITAQETDGMFDNGYYAAKSFISSFNFADWVKRYRS
jgi:NTE family protein